MANIQLGREIQAVEALIEERSRDLASRQMQALAERFGRRPEFRYLQALFDATFEERADREVLRDLTGLVADQPDFTEAVALLAFVYDRAGDRAKAEVFAREALHSSNPRALARARRVLGMPAPTPSPHILTPARGTPPVPPMSEPFGAVASPIGRIQPIFTPSVQPGPKPDRERTRTRDMVPFDTVPPLQPPAPASAEPAHSSQPELPAVETISFEPVGGVAPPPSIPPSAIMGTEPGAGAAREAAHPGRDAPTLPGFSQVEAAAAAVRERAHRAPTPPPTLRLTPPPSTITVQEPRSRSRPDLQAVGAEGFPRRSSDTSDLFGPESRPMRPSRSAIAIPPPLEVQRQWFKYARQHQVTATHGDSTALTLLGLAERVMEGRTPLSAEPISLDRRGLIQVEQKLESFRGNPSPDERAATTSSAAFLLAVLMKESEARAVDTTPEDGACKAVLPSGAAVRPLLIAAAFVRGRGPGLVESFDRAATAHMRTPRAPAVSVRHVPTEAEPHAQGLASVRPSRRGPLSVPRRDLDAGTLCLLDAAMPMSPAPQLNLRQVAIDFWSSKEGTEVASGSRRVGTFTLADIDVLERHATRVLSPVGFWPPGLPWPWAPTDDQQRQILSWGAILGEVLCAVYTGRWEADPSDPHDHQLFRVVLANSVIAWPVAKVYLRLARGVGHDLALYGDIVGRIVGRQATRALEV